ncbi:hypothetical protein ScPMuIL_002722 [Solemya velum]
MTARPRRVLTQTAVPGLSKAVSTEAESVSSALEKRRHEPSTMLQHSGCPTQSPHIRHVTILAKPKVNGKGIQTEFSPPPSTLLATQTECSTSTRQRHMKSRSTTEAKNVG